jgi:hypothetical protein
MIISEDQGDKKNALCINSDIVEEKQGKYTVKIIHLWTEGRSMEFAYPVPVTEKSIWFYREIPPAEDDICI